MAGACLKQVLGRDAAGVSHCAKLHFALGFGGCDKQYLLCSIQMKIRELDPFNALWDCLDNNCVVFGSKFPHVK